MGSSPFGHFAALNIRDLMYKSILEVEIEIMVSLCSNYIDFDDVRIMNVR